MENLIQLLVTCEKLCRKVEELYWADKIKRVLQKNGENADAYLLSEIISWYGGMGSFNDLIISKYNGHQVNGVEEDKLNDELSRLRSAIYQEVVHLKRNL
jgi:hypothetical protein